MEERGLAKATAMLKKTKKSLEVLHCSCVSLIWDPDSSTKEQ